MMKMKRTLRHSQTVALLLALVATGLFFTVEVPDKSGNGGLWVFGEREGSLCNESSSVSLSEQTFRRLANSKRVEARLGSATLLLDDVALSALRYFAGHITKGAV